MRNVSVYHDRWWEQVVVEKFRTFKTTESSFLNLSSCGLYAIPEEVYELPRLRLLDLSRNRLTQLPGEIGKLNNLIELILSENQLSTLPPEVGQLKSLQRLYVSGNQLTSLPRELSEIEGLRILSLGRNRLPPPYNRLISPKTTLTARNVLSFLRDPNALEKDEDLPPMIPESGPGSNFVPTSHGYELVPPPLEQSERGDPMQQALHARLKRRIERLQRAMGGVGNTHPELAAEFADYATFVTTSLDELDVPSLWSAGTGLSEFVRVLDTQHVRTASGVMTEPLEPETLGALRALMRDHTAFILGFARGREMMARAQALRDVERAPEEIKVTTLAVLRSMLAPGRLLAERAQHLVQSLSRSLAELDTTAYSLLASGGETGKNGLIAFGRALHPILVIAGSTDVALILAGNPHADTLRVTLTYVRENADTIAAFAASDPQMSTWLTWLLDRARRLLKDFNDAM